MVTCALSCRDPARPSDLRLYLAGNNHLITDVRLTDVDVRHLCETLHNNQHVTNLDLRFNRITDEGAKHVAKLLEVKDGRPSNSILLSLKSRGG